MTEKSEEASASAAAGSDASGNWWDTWLSSAKTKSAEVYSMVRKDLDEIGSAVKSEANHVFSTTSTVIGKTLKLDVPESPANVMKKSFSSFIGQVSTALSPENDDEDDTEVILSSGDTTMLSTYKKELEALQRVDATFIVPAYSAEFDAWLASLETGGEPVIAPSSVAKRLDSSPLLKEQYNRLVPDAVTHEEFWERYLFRVALLQDRLAAASRKQPADVTDDPVLAHLPLQSVDCTPQQSPKKQPSLPSAVPSVVDSDSPYETPDIETVAWEDEDFANDVELTEEQQILLLEEYEKEITSKKQATKQTSSKDIANNNTEDKTTNTTATKKKTINTKTTVTTKTSTATTKSSTASTKNSTSNTKNVKTSPNKTPVKAAEVNKTNTGFKSRDRMNNRTVKEPAKKSPMKGKTDDCGNNIVEDYFGDNQVKDDASANSDESWEKEFEIEDVEKA
ncbi:hypothetical protein O0L34_g3532 [Tuta absoluta]|nr:hypothetical protein O0L34_g3532 [Tuta absoluta]